MSRTCWVDGQLVPVAEARVSAFDRAFRSGEGVFETFRSYGRFVFRMDEHLERAVLGARVLGFELPSMQRAVQAVVDDNVPLNSTAAVRLVATPGDIDPDSPFPGTPVGRPTIVVTVHDLIVPKEPTTAITVPFGREVAHVKAVSYLASLLAKRAAREQGAGEALLTDDIGNVLEASGANVFAVIDGVLVTPPVDGSILPGVTRQVVLEVASELGIAVRVEPLALASLVRADEAMLTASTREVFGLVSVDRTTIGDGTVGPLTRRLAEGYADVVRREAAS